MQVKYIDTKRTSRFSFPRSPASRVTIQGSPWRRRTTRLYSHHVASEMKWKSSAFTLDGKQLFKQSGPKIFFRIFSLVRRCACGCSGRAHSLEKIVKIFFLFFFFYCQQAVNHFPLKHKSGVARASDLMYPDRISFSPLAFFFFFYRSLFIVAHQKKKALSGV